MSFLLVSLPWNVFLYFLSYVFLVMLLVLIPSYSFSLSSTSFSSSLFTSSCWKMNLWVQISWNNFCYELKTIVEDLHVSKRQTASMWTRKNAKQMRTCMKRNLATYINKSITSSCIWMGPNIKSQSSPSLWFSIRR